MKISLVQDLMSSQYGNLFRAWEVEEERDIVEAASALVGFDDPNVTGDEGCFLHLISR